MQLQQSITTTSRATSSGGSHNVRFGPGIHDVGDEGLQLGVADDGVGITGEGPGVTVLTGGTLLPPWSVG